MTEAQRDEEQQKQREAEIKKHVDGLAILAKLVPDVATTFYRKLISNGFDQHQAVTLTAAWLASFK